MDSEWTLVQVGAVHEYSRTLQHIADSEWTVSGTLQQHSSEWTVSGCVQVGAVHEYSHTLQHIADSEWTVSGRSYR